MVLTTGAALNPTIALGLELNSLIIDGDIDHLKHFYIYMIGPHLGGFAAGFWFKKVHNPTINAILPE